MNAVKWFPQNKRGILALEDNVWGHSLNYISLELLSSYEMTLEMNAVEKW